MPTIRRLGTVAATSLLALFVAACGDTPDGPTTPPDLVVQSTADTLFAGDSARVTATVRVHGAAAGSVGAQWTSSDTAVATVSDAGWVRARRAGSVTITAEALGARAQTMLRVRATPAPTTITFPADSETVFVAAQVALQPQVATQYGTPMTGVRITWASSDTTVATVDTLGRVHGVAPGRVTVHATAGAARSAVTVDVRETIAMAQVVAGARHSCGLGAGGAAWCWGYNRFASIGNGRYDTVRVRRPERVRGSQRFARLAAGVFHTCGLTPAGAAWCWGDGARGQLGTMPTIDCGVGSFCSPEPVPVQGAPALASLSLGFDHSCGLTAGGAAWCWGFNASGELGIDDTLTVSSVAAREVAGGLRFTQLTAGDAHSCGLATSGEAWCWGDHYWGQIGDSTPSGNQLNGVESKPRPRRVAGGLRFTVLAASRSATCGITTAGAAYCWGFNARYWNGQTPQAGSVRNYMESTYPLPVVGATNLGPDLLVVGDLLQCGRAVEGGLRCWGLELEAAVTTGTTRLLLPAARIQPDVEWRELTSIGAHYCGNTTDGRARCFGFNGDGQLGDGTTTSRTTPVAPYGVR